MFTIQTNIQQNASLLNRHLSIIDHTQICRGISYMHLIWVKDFWIINRVHDLILKRCKTLLGIIFPIFVNQLSRQFSCVNVFKEIVKQDGQYMYTCLFRSTCHLPIPKEQTEIIPYGFYTRNDPIKLYLLFYFCITILQFTKNNFTCTAFQRFWQIKSYFAKNICLFRKFKKKVFQLVCIK